jgi:hypothetical protein
MIPMFPVALEDKMGDGNYPVDIPVDIKGLAPLHLNIILDALSELPYKVVRPIFDFIHPQVLEQVKFHYESGFLKVGDKEVGGERSAGEAVPAVQGQPGPVDNRVGIPSGSVAERYNSPASGRVLVRSAVGAENAGSNDPELAVVGSDRGGPTDSDCSSDIQHGAPQTVGLSQDVVGPSFKSMGYGG